MTRGDVDRGDTVVVSTVAGASHKSYPLAQIPNNYSYEDVSDQPEAQPNQPVSWPLSFHGGLAYSRYDPNTAGAFTNSGLITSEPNAIGAQRLATTVTLTNAANPPMYAFEADVNDSGADDGKPRQFIIACEAAEINVYKVSLAHGSSGTGTASVTTTDTTLTDTRVGGSTIPAWTASEWIGEIVTCNAKTLTVTGNTTNTLTGASWSGGDNPGDGEAWTIGVGPIGTLLNTKTFAVTPTQPMGKPVEWNDGTNTYWRLGTGDTTNLIDSLTSIASASSADTWSGGGDADARHLQLFGNKLARSTGSNEICLLAKGANPETEASWGDEFYMGEVGTNITELGESGGLLYGAKEDGFYEWDGVGEAVNILPAMGRATRNGQGMVYWHGGFLIPGVNLWWTRTGKPVGPDSNPHNRGNHPSLDTLGNYLRHGHWHGLAPFGEYIYALYLSSLGTHNILLQGRERAEGDPPGWGPIIWQGLAKFTGDAADFHGLFITETSELSVGVTRPVLWAAFGNGLSYIFLDNDGSPSSRRGEIDVAATASSVCSGDFDFGLPNVTKQLRVIEGWAEEMGTADTWRFYVYRDGGTYEAVGATITTDGFFQRFWVQDTADTARSMLVSLVWDGGTAITDTNGPYIRDPVVRALAQPNTARVWTFLLTARDAAGKTGKLVRSELEAYKNDLKKYELPDGDSFNGVLAKLELLRADEVRDLLPANQPSPHYVMRATVREMIAA